MPVVAVVNPKGGVGKTTLATNLAGAFAAQGHRTMLGDFDRQQSARDWLALRPASLPAISTEVLIEAFKAAQIPATPYALAIDPEGQTTAALASGDPYKGLAPSPLIPDESWVALQGICGG